MKILCLHVNSIKWKATKKAIKDPEDVKEKSGEVGEALAVYVSVEKGDEENPESVAEQLVAEVSDIAGQVGADKIVLYPYVHLTQNPGSPATALKILDLAEQGLDFEVHRSPFGWYKSFEIDVKGHPLAELSREFGPKSAKKSKEDKDTPFEFKELDKDDRLNLSAAGVVALAVKELYPEAGIGSFDTHFDQAYVDVAGVTIKQEALKRIEKKARGLLRKGVKVTKADKPDTSFQKEIASDLGKKSQVYLVDNLKLVPLHKDAFKGLKNLKELAVLHTGSAYWKGNASNQQLARIYCAGFKSGDEKEDYLKKLEEAEERSHTRIGERLELFTMFEKVGKGLPIWLPKGDVIRREVEEYAVEMEDKYGYLRVGTPVLGKKELFETSGHLPYYADSMYPPMEMDDGEYYLKAMNCPAHHLIYNRKMRSYRDLPLRLAEYGLCHRNELSGTLTGLQRVRSMSMNDAHIYLRKDQIQDEVERVIKMVQEYYEVFGLEDYWFRLSLSDLSSEGKYIDQPENWRYAEEELRRVLKKMKVDFVEARDEAAFYGPKIDIQFRNVFGKEDTMSTVQLDFVAKERFDFFYIDEDGDKNEEVFVIHRAPLSTHERFMAFLIEHYNGNFPLWLSPVQVRLMTIADRHIDFAQDVKEKLERAGARVEIDDRQESVGKKVRDAQVEKVFYMVTVGDNELDSGKLAVRSRDGDVEDIAVEDFVEKVRCEIADRN